MRICGTCPERVLLRRWQSRGVARDVCCRPDRSGRLVGPDCESGLCTCCPWEQAEANVSEAFYLGHDLSQTEIWIFVLSRRPFEEIAADLCHPVSERTCAAVDFFEARYA